MELTGTVKKILEKQTFNSGFTKQELILQTNEQYPQTIAVEFVQDRIDLLNDIQPGDNVKISINIRGREWVNPEGVTKYFNSINGWRIEKEQNTAVQPNPQQTPAAGNTTNDSNSFNAQATDLSKDSDDDVDDLPF